MIKVKFIEDYGIHKKGEKKEFSIDFSKFLFRRGVIVFITKPETFITGYKVLLKYGFNPMNDNCGRNHVVGILDMIEEGKCDILRKKGYSKEY